MLHRNFALSVALLCGLAACGSDQPRVAINNEAMMPIPPTYGLYAYDGEHLTRLDGDASWERNSWSGRSELPPKVSFMVYAPSLGSDPTPLQDLIELRRVAHVRNEVRAGGQVVPAQANKWAAPDLPDYRVALNFTPAPGRPDIVVATPPDPLPPGLYSFSLQSRPQPIDARLGIRWSDMNQTQYAEAHCVDSYPDGYRLCMDSDARANDPSAGMAAMPVSTIGAPATAVSTMPVPAATPSAPPAVLTVRNLSSQRMTVAGSQTLVVEADIVNTSGDIRALPSSMQLSLIGADGTIIQRIAVSELPRAMLAPGDSYHLRTEVQDPPASAVRVRLAPIS